MTGTARGFVSVIFLLASLAMSGPASAGEVDHVDPFIGTAPSNVPHPVPGGAMGDVFPGATVPFGALQWSPDTPGAENDTGYAYADAGATLDFTTGSEPAAWGSDPALAPPSLPLRAAFGG